MSELVERPDVILVGNGRRLVYRRGGSTPAGVVNQKEIKFTEVGGRSGNAGRRFPPRRKREPAPGASRTTGSIPTAAP